jgi:hypothetical protein
MAAGIEPPRDLARDSRFVAPSHFKDLYVNEVPLCSRVVGRRVNLLNSRKDLSEMLI